MLNVVHMPAYKTTRTGYKGKLRNAEAAMLVLRRRMHDHHVDVLAEKAGVSKSTIHAIKSGRTKWPRPNTFFNLLEVLNLDLMLVDR